MADGLDAHLPEDSRTQTFVFLVLFLVVMPVVVILAAEAPYVLAAAVGAGFLALVLQWTGVVGDDSGEDDEAVDPLTTLQDRYARGEIDEAEFERRLDVLVETEDEDLADASLETGRVTERER